jgi:hypothetical protein
MSNVDARKWSVMFAAAAIFNFVMGGPIFLAARWSYELAYPGESNPSTLRFWSDFGFAVLLIGIGYLMVAYDVGKNRGIVWLGIFAKLFDVVVLTWRASDGTARPIVLLPAAIDGIFVILFLIFLRTAAKERIQ